jgi:hypothetical protein
VVPGITSGLINYWPVENDSFVDLVADKNPTSNCPLFRADRLGNANGAVFMVNSTSMWTLPPAPYLVGDYTITLWAKNFDCIPYNFLCMFICVFLYPKKI